MEGSSVVRHLAVRRRRQSAAVLSYLAGAPVRLQFMRWDEHGWDHYGPAQLMDVRGGVDANGNSSPPTSRTSRSSSTAIEAGQQQLGAKPGPLGFNFIDATNMGAQYKIPNQRVTLKQLPLIEPVLQLVVPAGSARAGSRVRLRAADRRARPCGEHGPGRVPAPEHLEQRIRGAAGLPLTWDRWKNVLTEVAKISNWQPKVAASKLESGNIVTGRGIALGGFAGTMAGDRRRHQGEQEDRQDHA